MSTKAFWNDFHGCSVGNSWVTDELLEDMLEQLDEHAALGQRLDGPDPEAAYSVRSGPGCSSGALGAAKGTG